MDVDAFSLLKLFLVFGPLAGYGVLELLLWRRDRRRAAVQRAAGGS